METTHSRRLLYLFDSKKQLVDKLNIVDVNTEMQKAMFGHKSGESNHFIRESLQT